MATPLPPPTGDAKNPPTEVTVWAKLFSWLYFLWKWVTETLPGMLTFGGDAGSYSSAIFATVGQSDVGGISFTPGNSVVVTAHNTSGQTMTNSTTTVVTGWTSAIDTSEGAWNASTGTFTCRNAGNYYFGGKVRLANTSTGATFECTTVLRKNGSDTFNAEMYVPPSNGSAPSAFSAGIFSLVQGDTLQMGIFQSSGSNQTLTTTSQFNNLIIYKVA